VSGHWGEREGLLLVPPFSAEEYDTWSANLDFTAHLGDRLTFSTELFTGSVLGDYGAGILHTFNPVSNVGVDASGGWVELQFQATPKFALTAGYGLDDTDNADLGPGFRSKNERLYANYFYAITPRLYVASELSYWRTLWVDLPEATATRFEQALIYMF
jgi:hypothetical protein